MTTRKELEEALRVRYRGATFGFAKFKFALKILHVVMGKLKCLGKS